MSLQSMADTILYEEALKVILNTERAKYEGNGDPVIHNKNSEIYKEFWRREKPEIYYQAHNQVMKSIGKFKAEIK